MRFARVLAPLLLLAVGGCAVLAPAPSATPSPAVPSPQPVPARPADRPVQPELQRAYDAALAALRAGQLKEAEQQLLTLTHQAPELSGPYANLGLLYRRAGRNVESIAALERAVEVNPKRAVYYNELGIGYREAGKFDKARSSYRKAIDLDPAYAAAHLNLAILYDLYLQEPKDALPHYRRYMELVPAEASTVTKWIIDLERRTGSKPAKEKSG